MGCRGVISLTEVTFHARPSPHAWPEDTIAATAVHVVRTVASELAVLAPDVILERVPVAARRHGERVGVGVHRRAREILKQYGPFAPTVSRQVNFG